MVLNIYEVGQRVEDMSRRLGAIEEQLARVSEKVGVPYEKPASGVPSEVVQLALTGDRVGAMKRYRELTNATADEAREVLARI